MAAELDNDHKREKMKVTALLATAVLALAPVVGVGGSAGAAPSHPTYQDGCIYDYPALVISTDTDELCFRNPGTFQTGTGAADTAAYLWPMTYGTEEYGSYPGARVWFHQDEDGSGWADCYGGGTVAAFSVAGRDQTPGNVQFTNNTAPCP